MSQEWRVKPKPAEKGSEPYSCADWAMQIRLAERRNERWEERCKKIVRRYRAESIEGSAASGSKIDGKHGMNVLWSNVETLQPSIYGREPVPIAERRFLDKDVTGRIAAQILERAMRYEMGDCGFHDTLEQNVKDYLLVGRGVAWLRYKPVIGPATSLEDRGDDEISDAHDDDTEYQAEPDGDDDSTEGEQRTDLTPQEKLLNCSTDVEYVHWTDFLTSKARFWKEVEWVARRVYMSRDDLCDEYGDEIGEAVPLEMGPENDEMKAAGKAIDQASDSMRKAVVFEIWHKPTRKVYFIAKGFDKFLKEPEDDPLNLEGFWPCPKPLFATMTNDTLEPVPDYFEYQDQALQIDDLTNRIKSLTKALKVAGVYDAANKQLARLLDEGHENQLIPVPNFAALNEKGGLQAAVQFLPIKEVADTLAGLVEAREKVKQDMFEITGLSDIIRGQADPRETAEAVATKGRWGSLRLQARQAAVSRYCRDIIRMMGEIIAEHYPPEVMINISGAMFDEGIGPPPPDAPAPPDAPSTMPSSPMMGHNGGPPLTPPVAGPVPPAGAHIIPPPGAPMGMPQGPVAPPMSNPGMMGASPAMPPPPSPQMQYQMAMVQYQQELARHQAEKTALIMKAIALLKQDKMRGFRIDIETDSTVQNDANEEKASRIEFIEATTKFVEQAFKIGAENPDAAPMLGKMLLFGVRGFRAGRDLESTIEEFIDKMEKDAVARKDAPPPPNPEIQKAQLELQAVQAKSAAEIHKAQTDAQASAADNQRELEQRQLDQQLAQQQAQLEMQKMHADLGLKEAEGQLKMREIALKMQLLEQTHAKQVESMAHEHAMKMEQMRMDHASKVSEHEMRHREMFAPKPMGGEK
jgi:hypothetical protein